MLINCSFDECQKIKFTILDNHGQQISNTIKEGRGCFKNLLTDSDKFTLIFKREMSWNHRLLLLSAVLLIDYRMFGNASKEERGGEDCDEC